MDNENWEETFLKELTENEVESAMEVDDEEDECEATIVVPKLKTYKVSRPARIPGRTSSTRRTFRNSRYRGTPDIVEH